MVGPMDVVLFHPLTVVSGTTREREVEVPHPHEDKTEAMSLRSQADFSRGTQLVQDLEP
jgi:hypothetical protein